MRNPCHPNLPHPKKTNNCQWPPSQVMTIRRSTSELGIVMAEPTIATWERLEAQEETTLSLSQAFFFSSLNLFIKRRSRFIRSQRLIKKYKRVHASWILRPLRLVMFILRICNLRKASKEHKWLLEALVQEEDANH